MTKTLALLALAASPPSPAPGVPAPPVAVVRQAPAAYAQSFTAQPPAGARHPLEASIGLSLRKQRPGSTEDARLQAAAIRLLEGISGGAQTGLASSIPEFERVRILLWEEGIADAAFLPYRGRFASRARAQAAMKQVLVELAALPFNRFGVKVREDGKGVVDIGIVVVQRVVAFGPVPFRVDPPSATEGTPATPAQLLTSIATADPRDVRVVLRRPNGETSETPVGPVSAKPVGVAVVLGTDPGRYDVEIVFAEKSGPIIAAAFVVAVGTPFDVVYRPREWAVEVGKIDDAAIETRLGELLGTRRARYKLLPPKRQDSLDRIAREHSQEMARFGFGRVSAKHGSLSKRLENAGVYFVDATEVIGSGVASEGIFESLMTSPSHRLALLDGTLGDLGIGVVTVAAPAAKPGATAGTASAYVTLVLARVVPRIEAADAEQRLLDRVNETRTAAGLGPLGADPGLAAVARKHAAAMSSGGRPEYELPKHGSLFDHAKKAFPAAKALGGFVGVLGSVEDPLEFEGLLDPQMTQAGVGVVQASSKEYGQGALWVVFALAR